MVLAVVDFHGFGIDMGLQGVQGVRQGGQGVGHDLSMVENEAENFRSITEAAPEKDASYQFQWNHHRI
jgi:hypothetical protein